MRAKAANPLRPLPSNKIVAGSGTGAVLVVTLMLSIAIGLARDENCTETRSSKPTTEKVWKSAFGPGPSPIVSVINVWLTVPPPFRVPVIVIVDAPKMCVNVSASNEVIENVAPPLDMIKAPVAFGLTTK